MLKYPLSKNMLPEDIKSKTGRSIKDISIENILSGSIKPEDIKISQQTLLMQGEIAEREGRFSLKNNFTRAAELTEVPDKMLLEIYEKLRPRRSTREELLHIAEELENNYKAYNCSKLIREAVQVYEKRGLFRG